MARAGVGATSQRAVAAAAAQRTGTDRSASSAGVPLLSPLLLLLPLPSDCLRTPLISAAASACRWTALHPAGKAAGAASMCWCVCNRLSWMPGCAGDPIAAQSVGGDPHGDSLWAAYGCCCCETWGTGAAAAAVRCVVAAGWDAKLVVGPQELAGGLAGSTGLGSRRGAGGMQAWLPLLVVLRGGTKLLLPECVGAWAVQG